MEQKEEEWFLVLGLVFEGETQDRSQVQRVAIAPSGVHPLTHLVQVVLDPLLLHGCASPQQETPCQPSPNILARNYFVFLLLFYLGK